MLTSMIGSILLGCLTIVQAQPLLNNARDIGLFNGHLIGIDDINIPTYSNLRGFLGVNQLPVIPRAAVGGIPASALGVGPITTRRLRRCQPTTCPKLRINDNCEYTPILEVAGQYCRGCDQDICLEAALRCRGLNGLTGVAGRRGENREAMKEERKRLRKVQRRICRTTGVCPGNSRQELMNGQLKRQGVIGGGQGILVGGPVIIGGGQGNTGGGPAIIGGGQGIIGGGPAIIGGGQSIIGGGPAIIGGGQGIIGGGQAIIGGGRGIVGGGPGIIGVPGGIIGGGPGIGLIGGRPPIGLLGSLLGGQRSVIGGMLGNIFGVNNRVPVFTG